MARKGKSPAQNTLDKLRSEGWLPEITERWNAHAGIRQDLFDFGDVLALKENQPALIVQATSLPHVSERIEKIKAIPAARLWLLSGNLIEVWGWYKLSGRSRWAVARRRLILSPDGQHVLDELPNPFRQALRRRRGLRG